MSDGNVMKQFVKAAETTVFGCNDEGLVHHAERLGF
jgi:hypothetical protein